MNRIGLLIPYSGEFPGLKRALLDTFLAYTKANGFELFTEYIGKGDGKTVEKAMDKLFYNDDVDVIIGYVGYRVITNYFPKIRMYADKAFIHLSLGEVIPYSADVIDYPSNYHLVSLDAWRSIAFLGKWVAAELPAANCLICTSVYDAGYSLTDSFRIGYHSETPKTLQSCILNNSPKASGVADLFSEIRRIRSEHLHVTLCGRELDAFLSGFDNEVDYNPSVSFAFPVAMKVARHPSLQSAYTALTATAWPEDRQLLMENPFHVLFCQLGNRALALMEEKVPVNTGSTVLLTMNLATTTLEKKAEGVLPQLLNIEFNRSAEKTISGWQNPYLCI